MKKLQMSLIIFIAILIGAGAYTVYYGQGYSYLSDDPSACMNCHVMEDMYLTWETSSHRDVTCNECHVPHGFIRQYTAKATDGIYHAAVFTFDEPQVIRLRESRYERISENCIRCHESMVAFINRGDGQLCTDCHIGVGHPLQYKK